MRSGNSWVAAVLAAGGFLGSVHAQQPLESEFFDIVVVEASTKIWDDGGSGANRSVSIWKATPPSGYFTLGHVLSKEHDPDAKPVTIALRPKAKYASQKLLKGASGYREVWNDAGSGADDDVRIFEVQPGDGEYVALGMVASDGAEQPNDYTIGVIKKSALIDAARVVDLIDAGKFVSETTDGSKVAYWDDAGSGADRDVSLWKVVNGGRAQTNYVSLSPNTFFARDAHDKTPTQKAYSLKLLFNAPIDQPIKLEKQPTLNGPKNPTPEELKAMSQTVEYKVPFFAVNDPKYDSELEQFQASPFYIVERTSYYKLSGGFGVPTNGKSGSVAYTISRGFSREKNWNAGMGVAFGVSATVGVEASSGVATVQSSVTMSMETSFNYSWGGSSSTSQDESTTYTLDVDPGQWGAVVQEVSDYRIYRTRGGKREGSPISEYSTGDLDYLALYFDPNKIRFIEPGTTLRVGQKYSMPGSRYYLFFAEDGNVSVSTTDGGQHVWDLVTKFGLHDKLLNKAKKAVMQNDGNFTLNDASGAWLWGTQTTLPGSYLSINSKGNLVVLDPDGDELWNGSK